MRGSQLDPFSPLFMAKQPATTAVACMLFMAIFWIAVASMYTWLCFHVKFGWWVGASCLHSSGQAELRLQRQRWDLPALACHVHSPRLAHVWLQRGHVLWQSPHMPHAWGGRGGGVGCMGGSEVPPFSLTHVLGARGQSRRSLPMVPFRVLLCGVEPCQAQQVPPGETKPKDVSQEDAQCISASRHSVHWAGENLGRGEAKISKLQVLWTWGPQQCFALQTSSCCPAPLANTEPKRKLSKGPRAGDNHGLI